MIQTPGNGDLAPVVPLFGGGPTAPTPASNPAPGSRPRRQTSVGRNVAAAAARLAEDGSAMSAAGEYMDSLTNRPPSAREQVLWMFKALHNDVLKSVGPAYVHHPDLTAEAVLSEVARIHDAEADIGPFAVEPEVVAAKTLSTLENSMGIRRGPDKGFSR